MKNFVFVLSIFIISFFYSCSEKECFSPPETFRLILRHADGTSIINNSNKDSIKLFAVIDSINTVELSISILEYYNADTDINTLYLETAELPWKSLEGNKKYMLKITNNPIDLVVDVVSKSVDNCLVNPYNLVSYKGVPITNYDNKIGAYVVTE